MPRREGQPEARAASEKPPAWGQGLTLSLTLASLEGRSQVDSEGWSGFQHLPSAQLPLPPQKTGACSTPPGYRCSPFLHSPPPSDFDNHFNLVSSGYVQVGGEGAEADVGRGLEDPEPLHPRGNGVQCSS